MKNKEKVYKSYDEIVQWFDEARTKTLMESEYLNLIVNKIQNVAKLQSGSQEK